MRELWVKFQVTQHDLFSKENHDTDHFVVDKMRRHKEWLVDADKQGEADHNAERSDGERLAMVTHGEHMLIQRSTNADVAFDGEHDDDPSRREAKYVRQPPEHGADHCNTVTPMSSVNQPISHCSLKIMRSSTITERPRDALCQYVHVTFHKVWEVERFQSAKVTFKVSQRHTI